MRVRIVILALLSTSCAESHVVPAVPDGAPLPGELLEIELTDDERETFCAWWVSLRIFPEEPELARYMVWSCPPPGGDMLAGSIVCPLRTREEAPDCRARLQDWYDCELSMPAWWCERPPPEACRRPPNCGWEYFGP